jgi:hypothetical protein
MWRRWKAGESLHDIGRAFGKGHGSIRFLLAQRGGIVPAARRRSPQTLTLAEREDISRGIASGSSISEIAKGLQRAVSTVSREVARHGGRPLYRASEADRQAWESALRPKVCLLAIDEKLRTIVASKLILDWSPEQISKWLKVPHPPHTNQGAHHANSHRRPRPHPQPRPQPARQPDPPPAQTRASPLTQRPLRPGVPSPSTPNPPLTPIVGRI